jgi:adenylate cyclase
VFALLQLVESRHEEAIESARKAVTFHPNNAEAYANLGLVLAYSGLPAEAVAVTETGLRLNPAPPPSFQMFAGITFYTARQYDRAIEALTAVRDAFPTSETLRSHLAAAYAHQGRLDLAKVERDALLEVFPAANLSYYRLLYDYYRRDEDRAHHIAGLQKAGVAKWPFGFEGRDEDRLDGNSLMALTIGQTWVGKHPRGVAFIQAIDKAGNVAYRSANSFLTGTAQVRQNMLCQKFDGYFSDRVLCGYVYRNSAAADEADKDYVYVSPDSLKYFSLAE